MTTTEIVYTMERDLAESVRRLADAKRHASGNKLSLTLALLLIAAALTIGVVSRASGPVTEPPVLGCYLTRDCLVG